LTIFWIQVNVKDMPLIKSGSKEAISSNISEMRHAGHPLSQAIAAALETARRAKRMKKKKK